MSDSFTPLGEPKAATSRRTFLKVLGAAGATTAAIGCSSNTGETLIPYLVHPDETVPGVSNYYASTCRECAFAENAVRLQMTQRTQDDIELLDHVRWQPNRPRLIHDGAFDRLPYPPRRIGGEAKPALRVELFQGVDQAEIAFFDQIGER